MATSPITAKIFAGEALDEAEKKSLTQEQEWLHVLLQAGISNIRTWAEFKGHAIWRCFLTYGTTDFRTIMEFTNADINSLQCVLGALCNRCRDVPVLPHCWNNQPGRHPH